MVLAVRITTEKITHYNNVQLIQPRVIQSTTANFGVVAISQLCNTATLQLR